ncbi:hypothetical protein AAFF_G00273410 [Aldrovandia affinis]|uniref:Uncharacterized protein n=1 Tax=Aldrovandia affinis TaxID=143900 RepID=A0AAD7SRE6_9TELE|nr:hypothetical protein AAFF_G00273410 [Aldrovandia affinis]
MGLCSPLPTADDHDIEKRSSSGESGGSFLKITKAGCMMNFVILILVLSLTFSGALSGLRHHRSSSESDEVLYFFRYPTYFRHPPLFGFPFWPLFPRPAPGPPPTTAPVTTPRGDGLLAPLAGVPPAQ